MINIQTPTIFQISTLSNIPLANEKLAISLFTDQLHCMKVWRRSSETEGRKRRKYEKSKVESEWNGKNWGWKAKKRIWTEGGKRRECWIESCRARQQQRPLSGRDRRSRSSSDPSLFVSLRLSRTIRRQIRVESIDGRAKTTKKQRRRKSSYYDDPDHSAILHNICTQHTATHTHRHFNHTRNLEYNYNGDVWTLLTSDFRKFIV